MSNRLLHRPRFSVGNQAPIPPFLLARDGLIPPPLVAWSSIPGVAAMKDLTGRGRDLSVSGTATRAVSVFGAQVFNSPAGTANLWTASALPSLSAYSFLLLAKFDNVPQSATITQFRGAVTSDSFGFNYDHTSAGFRQAVQHRTSTPSFVAAKLTTSLAADTWYWIGGTWDGTNVRAYLNGVEEASAAAATINPLSGGIWLARQGGIGAASSWTVLHHFVWDVALSAGQMRALYDPQTRWNLYEEPCVPRVWPVKGVVGTGATTSPAQTGTGAGTTTVLGTGATTAPAQTASGIGAILTNLITSISGGLDFVEVEQDMEVLAKQEVDARRDAKNRKR